jgi:hypothetical protein
MDIQHTKSLKHHTHNIFGNLDKVSEGRVMPFDVD